MATTTATITLSSSDIADNSFSVSNTATVTKAGSATDIAKMTGLTRITTTATANVVLINSGDTAGNFGATAAGGDVITKGKFFIHNLNARGDGDKYVELLQGALVIGRLYGGDWAFFPSDGAAGDDIEITPSSTTETTLEYVMFYE